MKFIKKFNDAYSLSREYFFLDMLNQYGAPVPKVFQNNSEKLEIEMQFAGVDMHSWLQGLDFSFATQSYALKALFKAFESVKKISDHGVWHLDLAFRNFLIDVHNSAEPAVYIIDFSLAISSQLPLQKPLWIRPDDNLHHPLLKEAVILDWTNFFNQANLPIPLNFQQSFDIPLNQYSQIWLNNLNADLLSKPWCVITHSLGVLLCEASTVSVFDKKISANLNYYGLELQNLTSDERALAIFNDVLLFIKKQISDGTPIPNSVTTTPMPRAEPAVTNIATNNVDVNLKLPLFLGNYPKFILFFIFSIVSMTYIVIDGIVWNFNILFPDHFLFLVIFLFLSSFFCFIYAFISKKYMLWFLNTLSIQIFIFLIFALNFGVVNRLDYVSLGLFIVSFALTAMIYFVKKKSHDKKCHGI